jgi:hypothetical protein
VQPRCRRRECRRLLGADADSLFFSRQIGIDPSLAGRYLPFNYFAQIVVPVLQLVSVPILFRIALSGNSNFDWAWTLILYFGLLTFMTIALYSILLDRDLKTLRHLPVSVLLIAPLSYFYDFVVIASIWKELFRKPERWEKIERLPSGAIGGRGGMSLVLIGVGLVGLAGAVRLSTHNDAPSLPPRERSLMALKPVSDNMRADDGRVHDIAIATHFDSWQDWHSAITSVLQNPMAPRLHTVGLSAGRAEWAHFRWQGHQDQWSPQQAKASVDMLGEAVRDFKNHGFRTVAMVDLYSPQLARKSPGKAAVRFDGVRSTDQACFTELVDGEYGRQIVEMVTYLASNYPVDAVALTELGYYSFCFDDRCLASFHDATRRTAWPSKHDGVVADRDDPSVWEWRSAKMELFLQRVADAAHASGKQLIVDVPVSWKDLRRRGKDSGLDYTRVLRHADQIVVWNYFGVEQRRRRFRGMW